MGTPLPHRHPRRSFELGSACSNRRLLTWPESLALGVTPHARESAEDDIDVSSQALRKLLPCRPFSVLTAGSMSRRAGQPSTTPTQLFQALAMERRAASPLASEVVSAR